MLQLILSVAAAVVVASTFVLELVRLLAACSQGIDLSDEAFYIESAAHSHMEPLEGPWGDLLHYLYWGVGGDITIYRAVSLCILVASGCLLGAVVGRACVVERDSRSRNLYVNVTVVAYILLGGDLTLIFYGSRILTPGYNWVNLVGLNLTIAGLICVRDRRLGRPRLAAQTFLIVIGMLFVFSARIATFVVLAIVVIAFLCDSQMFNLSPGGRRLGQPVRAGSLVQAPRTWITLLVSLSIICAYFIFIVSPQNLIAGTRRQVRYGQISHLLQMSTMLRTDIDAVGHVTWSAIFAARYGLAAIAGLTVLSWSVIRSPMPRANWIEAKVVGFLFGITVVLVIIAVMVQGLLDGTFVGGQTTWTTMTLAATTSLIIALAGLLGRLISATQKEATLPQSESLSDSVRIVAMVGVAMPALAFGFGLTSANGLIAETSLASPLIFLAAVLLVGMQFSRPAARSIGVLAVGCVAVFAVARVVNGGLDHPYRITEVRGQRAAVAIGSSKSRIALAEPDRVFISGLQVAAANAGFEPGQPIEDFSPFNPGVGLVIGARPAPTVFLAALSQDPSLFQWTLSLQSARFKDSGWLVLSSDGPNLEAAAKMIGCHPPNGYRQVFEGYWAPEQEWLYLFKPVAAASSTCQSQGTIGG